MKSLSWVIAGISMVTFVSGAPPAYAIFGIRAARTAIAARKAGQMTASSSSASEDAYAQEEAKFNKPAGSGRATERTSSNVLSDQERP